MDSLHWCVFGWITSLLLHDQIFKLIDPTVVSFIRSLEIIFAYIIQVVIMHQIPDYLAGIGAILVLISVGSIALQDFLLKKK